jgi:hypothetical protein
MSITRSQTAARKLGRCVSEHQIENLDNFPRIKLVAYFEDEPVIPQDRLGALLPCVLSKTPFVGRVLLSAIFNLCGLSKLPAPTATIGDIASAGLPFPALGHSVG